MVEYKCDFCDKLAVVDGKTKKGPWAYMCDDHWKNNGIDLLGYYSYLNVPTTDLPEEHLRLLIELIYHIDKSDSMYTHARNRLIVNQDSYKSALSNAYNQLKNRLDNGMITQEQYVQYLDVLNNK